jgi:hypothetical protein
MGSHQFAEILLNNTGCDSYAQLAILTTDGADSHEEARELPPWTFQILPFIEGESAGPNMHLFVRVTLSPGPCAAPGSFQAVVAIVNPDGSTAAQIALVGDPGDEAQDNAAGPPLVRRIGPWQTAELTVWNGCPVAITARLETTNLSTGESDVHEVDIEPFGIGVISPIKPSAGRSIVSGMDAWEWRKEIEDGTVSDTDPCPPDRRLVVASESLVNADGGTASASGLPTGKRQHKPFSLTNLVGNP